MAQTLTTVELGHNGIGETGGCRLADALKVNTVSAAVSSFTLVLPDIKGLTSLNLEHNDFGDVGVQYFGDALRTNSVDSVLLSYNHRHLFHRHFAHSI